MIRIQYSPNVCLVQSPLSPVGCNTHVFCVLQLCASVVTKIIFLSLFMNLSGFGEKINRMDVNRQLIGNCSDSWRASRTWEHIQRSLKADVQRWRSWMRKVSVGLGLNWTANRGSKEFDWWQFWSVNYEVAVWTLAMYGIDTLALSRDFRLV